MLNQAIEVFKKIYKEKGDSIILDEYVPADGTYVIVKPQNDSFKVEEILDIEFKKNNVVDKTISKYMEFIVFADYYSQLISMNKAILHGGGKIIQGNNYLTFIIKKESLHNGKLKESIINEYYEILKNPRIKHKKKKEDLALYETIEEEIGEVKEERLNKIKNWISENIFVLFNEYDGKDYLKIFFYYPKEEYIKESKRYYIPKLYNSNTYNEHINNTIYGLPSNNLGLNSKKPYLENKSRKTRVPYLLNQEEVMEQKKFFDFLKNKATIKKTNIYIGEEIQALENHQHLEKKFNGIFLKIKKGMEAEIHDFDIITDYNPDLKKIFIYENMLGIDHSKLKTKYGKIKTLNGLHKKIDEIAFNKLLINNYFTEPKDIKINNKILKYNLINCRTSLFNWFYKGNSKNVWNLLEKAISQVIKKSIINGYNMTAANQFNLKHSLTYYFKGGNKMGDIILNTKDKLREKISLNDTSYIENDNEYFFAVGQLVSYFISRSKGKKKPLSLANPFINAKKDKIIKEKLKALYKKYNYDIESYHYRFKSLFAMVASYSPEEEINEDMIIAGYLHSNLLYEKLQKNEEKTIEEV